MMLKRLEWKQIEELYGMNMQEDFPAGELKPLSLLRCLYQRQICKAYGFYDEGESQRLAYAIFEKADKENVWLLDYLAVEKTARGSGIGSRVIKAIRDSFSEPAAVMLEIERLDEAENEKQQIERERRKNFYLKNGLVETGVYTIADGNIGYEILCLPIQKEVMGIEAVKAMQNLYETFFEEGEYQIL